MRRAAVWNRLALPALLALALGMRLYHLDLIQFNVDCAQLLGGAAAFLASGRIPLAAANTFSNGMHQPPLITFIYAAPMLLSRNPAWIAGVQAAVDAVGVLFVYHAARLLMGQPQAAAAAALYAVSPAVITQARHIWNPSLLPLLSALALWGLISFHKTQNARHFAIALAAAALASELELPSAVALLVVAIAGAAGWRALRGKPLAIAISLVGLTLAPYLYLQVTTRWADLKIFEQFLHRPAAVSSQSFWNAIWLVAGDFQQQIAAFGGTRPNLQAAGPAGLLLLLLLAAGCIRAVLARSWAWALPVLWLAIPVLLSIRASQPIYPQYLQGVLPAAFLLIAGSLAGLPAPPMAALTGAFVLLRIIQLVGFNNQVAAQDVHVSYGEPLRYSQAAAQQAAALAGGQPIYAGWHADPQGLVFRYLLPGRPVVTFQAVSTFVFAPGDALYLLTPDGHALAFLRQLGIQPSLEVGPPSKPDYAIVRVPPGLRARVAASPAFQPLDASVGGLAHLDGYVDQGIAAGQASPVAVLWDVLKPPPTGDQGLRQFGHLVDASGKQWSTNQDFMGYPASDWRAGDSVLSWFDLRPRDDTPTGGYLFQTGLYEFPNMLRLPVSQNGKPAGTSIVWGPLKVAGRPPSTLPAAQAVFGAGEIGLAGISVQGHAVDLTWVALKKPAASYTAFVHVLNAQGQLVAQHDGPPERGDYPTTMWAPGEVIHDVHPLAVSIQPGETLEVGLYTTQGQQRLPEVSTAGHVAADSFRLPAAAALQA